MLRYCPLTEPQRKELDLLQREGSRSTLNMQKRELLTLKALTNKGFVRHDKTKQVFTLVENRKDQSEHKIKRWPAVYSNTSREEHVNRYLNNQI